MKASSLVVSTATVVAWCMAASCLTHARPSFGIVSMSCAFVAEVPRPVSRKCISALSARKDYEQATTPNNGTRPTKQGLFEKLGRGLLASLNPRHLFEKTPKNDNADVESKTLKWIYKNVIGLNLCPFAERPIQLQQLSIRVVRGDDPDEIAQAVTEEMLSKRDEIGTVIVIAPDYFPHDFERYLDMLQYLEQGVMEALELHHDVQIAPFHPLLAFQGTAGDSVENYVNRSPYPMFHILRKDDVNRAVTKLNGDIGKVWRRNKRLLLNLQQELGREAVVEIMTGVEPNNHEQEEVIETMLTKTGVEMAEDEKKRARGEKLPERDAWRR